MDPTLDPPPVSGAAPAGFPVAAAASPTPAQSVARNHPPYAEMISAAISALNERGGSSKRAIVKYIETHYSDLPQTYRKQLDRYLTDLKTSGQLVMVKHSYKLPTRSTAPPVNGAGNAVSAGPSSSGTKKRGRPPKPKPDAVQAAVPVFGDSTHTNAPGTHPPENVAVGPGAAGGAVNGGTPGGSGKRRGRPPKRERGRPEKSGVVPSGGSVGRGRGRPKKNSLALALAPVAIRGNRPGRPRGRPPKPINAVGGSAPGVIPAVPVQARAPPAPVAGKRRGRPPKADNAAKKPRSTSSVQPSKPRKPRKTSGKPLGRPKKNAPENEPPESQLIVSYLQLKAKLDTLKEKVAQTSALVKPSLNGEAEINALQELEVMAANISAAPDAQILQEQQQQPQPEI